MEEKFVYFVLFQLCIVWKIKVGSGATNLFSLSSDKLRSGSQIFVVDVVTNIYYLETAALLPSSPFVKTYVTVFSFRPIVAWTQSLWSM